MRKLLIALMIILLPLKVFAPTPSISEVIESRVLEEVANISDSIDINHVGIQNIPLQPFTEMYTDISTKDTLQRDKPFIISSSFGMRMHPILRMWLLHTGIDVLVDKGAPILASGDGEIISVDNSNYGYGIHIIIKHNKEFKTLYAHLSKALVKKGDIVRAGEVIGLGGHTGLVSGYGCHIHFELIYKDKKVDPLKFIGAKTAKDFRTKLLAIQRANYIIWSS